MMGYQNRQLSVKPNLQDWDMDAIISGSQTTLFSGNVRRDQHRKTKQIATELIFGMVTNDLDSGDK